MRRSVIRARLQFPPRESRLDVGQRIYSCYWFPPFLGHPVEKEYRDDGRVSSTIRIPHPRMIVRRRYRTQTRARHTRLSVVVGRRRNETLQSGVPREYGPCERSKSWPTSLPGFEKLSPRAARAFTREPRAAGCTRDRGFPRSSSSLRRWCTVGENVNLALKTSVCTLALNNWPRQFQMMLSLIFVWVNL